ncbi:uncharacterized protein [Delphinus delphis]|uniref:uncharacterized protein n=1 Tax=Delphinus delphis TaxID=9728 RepID=UPI0037527311
MRRQQRRQLRARGPAPRLLAAKLGTTHSAPPASLLPSEGVPAPRSPSPLPQAGSPAQAPRVGGAEFAWQAGLRLSGSPSPPSGILIEAPGDQSNTSGPPGAGPAFGKSPPPGEAHADFLSPLRSGRTQPRPQLPAPLPSPAPQPPPGFQQQQLWGPQPRLPRPHTAPSPAVPRCRAKDLEGSATQETNVLGASPAPFPRARRAPVTSASSSPLLRPPGSKPQARSPRVPVPRRPLPGVPCVHQTLPGAAPSVSAVLARAAPEPSPKLAAKLAPPARRPPLTGGKGRCARAQSPRRPPPARCMSPRLGSVRWRVLS